MSDDKSNKKLFSSNKDQKCDISGISPLKKEWNSFPLVRPKGKGRNTEQPVFFLFRHRGQDSSALLPYLCPSSDSDMPTISIMKDGFRKPLRRLKPHKASGPNKLPTGLPKTDEITSLPTLVFQISLQQGRTSTDWRDWNIATVTPSFNKGDKRNPSNYRSVSWNTLYTAPLCKQPNTAS